MFYFQPDYQTTHWPTNSSPLLSPVRNVLILSNPLPRKKIKRNFSYNPQKASGSYGFRGKFFQAYWPIIGKEVTRAIQVKAFSSMGNFPFFNLHHIMIKHIPGKDNFEAPDHFWPISLNNTIYKAISKILVQRLRLILKWEIRPF